ncbi:MAG: fibronectin type III domain-containing protein, partial [Bacteroidia bacterium]
MALCLTKTNTFAQVAGYSFTQSSGSYIPIVGGTVPAIASNPGAWDDGVSNVVGNIGFTFIYNGIGYSQCSISSNGAIAFGTTAITSTNYASISSTAGYAGSVAAWSRDLQGQATAPLGEIRYLSSGGVFTIQWSNTRRYNSTTANAERFEMQIKLYQTTNVIQVIYGTWSDAISAATTNVGQVGLRGATNADFNNRSVLTGGSWSASVAGAVNTATCFYNQSNIATKPAFGQTYTWSPPTCFLPTALTVSAITTSSATLSWTAPSLGTPVNYNWEVRTSGAAGSGAAGLTASGTTAHPTVTAPVAGLSPATTYSAYVRTHCGGTDFSSWSVA